MSFATIRAAAAPAAQQGRAQGAIFGMYVGGCHTPSDTRGAAEIKAIAAHRVAVSQLFSPIRDGNPALVRLTS